MSASTPILEPREAQDFAEALRDRLPGYVPGWEPGEEGPSAAVFQTYARYLEALAERVNRAPDKNKLAFLDRLGISLLPAQAARAPVVFHPMPHVGDSRVPARTRVGAEVAGLDEPLVFETERAMALAAAQLAEVVTLWPGKDAYADHSAAAMGGEAFTLFEPLQPIPHELYLAHDTHFALAGKATVEVQFEFAEVGSAPLTLAWEYWDGEGWRGFKSFVASAEATDDDSLDGTEGLTRSGTVRLVADCAETEPTSVHGLEAYWLRARVTEPMPPESGRVLPLVDRVRLHTVLLREGCLWSVEVSRTESATPTLSGSVLDDRGNSVRILGLSFWRSDGFAFSVIRDEAGSFSVEAPSGTYTVTLTRAHDDFTSETLIETTVHLGSQEVRLDFLHATGLDLDQAFAQDIELDLSKTFHPFGQQPQPGTAFYFASEEVFTKPGAEVTLCAVDALTPQESSGSGTATTLEPVLAAEYWNGTRWSSLGVLSDVLVELFTLGGSLDLTLPLDLQPVEVNNTEALWMRVRIASGTFGRTRTITWTDSGSGTTNTIDITETVPPALATLALSYFYRSAPKAPEACLTFNDFQWAVESAAVRWRGATFEPFSLVEDRTPALYLGFDQPLPADLVSLYFDVQEVEGETSGPVLRWEYWSGDAWQSLAVEDETNHLALPGIVAALWPGTAPLPAGEAVHASGTQVQMASSREAASFRVDDLIYVGEAGEGELARVASIEGEVLTLHTPLEEEAERVPVSVARLPRFGTPRTWIRARLQTGGTPRASKISGVHLNAVWASQIQTFESEVLGSSDGQPNQVFFMRQTPVLDEEVVEVRELEGRRAAVELPILQRELAQRGVPEDAVRIETDPRTGDVAEVWVRWERRPNLFFSSAGDRHYVLERSRGRLLFGTGRAGLAPPAGRDNVRVRTYRSGGGVAGNVPAGAITQLMSGVLAERVTNPRAAEGGADGEPVEGVLRRGPRVLRHRYQALSLSDYEALAREASPAVAVARALPTTHPSGRPAPGWVKLIIMPQSQEPQPEPSFELRRRVLDHLAARMPAAVAGQLVVRGPAYLPIGVEAVVAPLDAGLGGPVLAAVTAALERFLHPLTGGPDEDGWPFGRDAYQSDVAAVLEAVEGVDYVETINLLLAGTPRGERVEVPTDRIVVAGPLRITLTGGEG